jgi:hypothetical protein
MYTIVARRHIILYGISTLLYVYFYLSSFLSSVYVKSVKINYSSCSNGECYLPGCLLISTTTTGNLTTFQDCYTRISDTLGTIFYSFLQFQLRSNRDFVAVALFSPAQTPGQPTTSTTAVRQCQSARVVCLLNCLYRGHTVLLPSSPVPSGSAVPWAALATQSAIVFFCRRGVAK